MKLRMPRIRPFEIVNGGFMLLLCFSILYPFWDMLITSFSSPADAMKLGFTLVPDWDSLTTDAYVTIFKEGRILTGYTNAIFRSVVGTVLMVLVCTAAAYPLSKRHLPYRRGILFYMVFTMYFSGGMIPTYLLIRNLGLIDSLWALILPSVAVVFNIILIRNYIMAVIDISLEEVAQIDGANPLVIFWKIIIPLSKPVLATVALWSMVGHWNEWFQAMLYTSSPDKQVVQLMLRKLLIESSQQDIQRFADMAGLKTIRSPESLKAAFLYLTITPIIIVYPFLQKYFIRGIMLGAVKG